jgi:enterochelin esterase family protein
VPKQYDGTTPANLIVFQDGMFYLGETPNAAAVLDSMIAAGELPPTVGVFIEPGDLIGYPSGGRHNRSFEYDRLSDAYVRLVLEDVLPRAIGHLNISTDPARRVICGMSSGGLAAMVAAWHRPDQFGGVISHCGSFTNVRSAGAFPAMVREEAKRPIRVFLQSGANDMNRAMGSWAVANFDMAAALKLRGYDYRLEFGHGGHTLHHGAAIFPQTLRWIWRP